MPKTLQTLGWWTRTAPFFERCRARYGNRFTMLFLQTPPFVHLADPEVVKEVFTASPEVLHPGEGARILEPIVGRNSLILLDEGAHMGQRKLMLPAFHGERMDRLSGLVAEVAEREVARWPRGEAFELHARLQALTLEIIMRAVFGVDPGGRYERLREKLNTILEVTTSPTSMLPAFQRGARWRSFVRDREEADSLMFELIDERRRDPGDGDDVLTMLLEARHEDGSPMSAQELRDELMTLLVAGHETTATTTPTSRPPFRRRAAGVRCSPTQRRGW